MEQLFQILMIPIYLIVFIATHYTCYVILKDAKEENNIYAKIMAGSLFYTILIGDSYLIYMLMKII